MDSSLSPEKKLVVTYRIEPGCLGPNGQDHIQSFCDHAEKEMAPIDAGFVCWNIKPRRNKGQAEMQYSVNQKKLTHDMAERYLRLFNKDLDEFESHLQDKLAELIDNYQHL